MTEVRGQRSEIGGRRSARRRSSSIVRRLIKWALLTVACLMGLIGLLWGGLQTPWAKTRLENLVSSLTAKTGDYQVAIQGLDGLLPFSITLKQATISDAKGPWLKMEKFDFSMKPWDLISGLVHIKWLRMEHLTISRLPESREPAPKKEETPTQDGVFSLPHILVQEIRLQRIDLGETLAGKPMAFSLNSRLKTAKDRIQAEASLLDLNRDNDAFKLKAAYGLKNEHLTADMTYHESKGGLVAGLLGLKDLEGIQLTATAQGPVSHMKGDLNLNMGGYGSAALQYDVSHQETVTLQLNGQIKADSRIMPPQVARIMTSETVDLTCHGSLSPEKELLLKNFRIKNGDTVISLEGNADLKKEKMDMRVLIEGAELTPFLAGTGISLDGLRPVSISAVGPFMAPEVNISTALAGFKTQGATVNETTLNIRALFEKGFTGLKSASVALSAQKLWVQQAPIFQPGK